MVVESEALETLQEIAGDDGGAFMMEVVGLFLDDAAVRIADLTGAASQSDWETAAKAAHALKSASANVGALPLSQSCARLESSVREGEPRDAMAAHADRVARMFLEVREALAGLQASFGA